jgi:hypothetical protein
VAFICEALGHVSHRISGNATGAFTYCSDSSFTNTSKERVLVMEYYSFRLVGEGI